MKNKISDEARFWGYVNKNHSNGCWVWGKTIRNGYGRFCIGGKHYSSHRIAYEKLVGKIPDGMTLDHLCRNRACVNPSHLEMVDMKTNCLRGIGPTAINARKKYCIRGHKLEGKNLENFDTGGRVCRLCRLLRMKSTSYKKMKSESDRKWRLKNQKKCPDCQKLIRFDSSYCRRCTNIHYPKSTQFKIGHLYYPKT